MDRRPIGGGIVSPTPTLNTMRVRGIDEWRVASRILRLPTASDPNGCWLWTGSSTCGYGRVKFAGRAALAHRIAYHLWNVALIDGMEIDHLCFTPLCVNPAHLEQVTPLVNKLRAAPRATACGRGHLLTGENLYVAPSGARDCRRCKAIRRTREVVQ